MVDGATLGIGLNVQPPVTEASKQDLGPAPTLPRCMVVQTVRARLRKKSLVTLILAQLMVDGATLETGQNVRLLAEEVHSLDPEPAQTQHQHMVVTIVRGQLGSHENATQTSVHLDYHPGLKTSNGAMLEFLMDTLA